MPYKRHDIAEIKAINRPRAAGLRRLGIRSTEDLLLRPEPVLRLLVGRVKGFPVKRLAEFRAQAALMQIDGLTYEHAEALHRAGYRMLTQLAVPDPAAVARALGEAAKKKSIPGGVDAKTVTRWQKRALEIAYSGKVAGTITDGEKPVAGATVICGFERAETDEGGGFHLPFVPAGRHRLVVRAEGFKRAAYRVSALPGESVRFRLKLTRGEDEPVTLDEAQGQLILSFKADDELAFEDRKLADLPDGTPLHFRGTYGRGGAKVRLLGVYRRREGHRIIVPRVVVPADAVGKDAKVNDVYVVEGGRLRKTRKKFGAMRRELLLAPLKARGVKANLVAGKEAL